MLLANSDFLANRYGLNGVIASNSLMGVLDSYENETGG